ncbi:phenylacetate-coenzyme A ligase PaaK-like adenylate-forming protein [Kitasatospora sp. MAP5-34]|nr:phenylacetate-coenzyme A ligase PaaK-like adenylate-forming protein [Kitasatospora sp. MAP5-34]
MPATEERPVLVATEADDVTADMVITELNRRNVPVVRFNPADIGAGLAVSARFGTCPAAVAGRVRTPSRVADLAQVRAASRHPGDAQRALELVEPTQHRRRTP